MSSCPVEAPGPDTSRRIPHTVGKQGVGFVDMDMLGTLGGIEQLRQAEPNPSWQLGARIAEPGGPDLMVEIAHDLRSPLTSILFLSETLHSGHSGNVNELQRRQLALIYSAALGLSRLVSNSIELACGGEQLADSELCPFSITQTLEAVRDMVRPMAEEKNLALYVRAQANDLRLGHPVALSRALLNLACNAVKFTDRGFVEIAAVAKPGGYVQFSVRDTGPGIDHQALHQLYQPFRHSRTGRGLTFSGTGLGLAISQRLLAAMGSELQVETGSNWGTRFYFDVNLPLADDLSAPLELQTESAGPRGFEARAHLRPRSHSHPRRPTYPNSRSTARRAITRAHH